MEIVSGMVGNTGEPTTKEMAPLTPEFNPLNSSKNQQPVESTLVVTMKNTDNFCYVRKPSCATKN